uniref:Deoxyribonuclease-1 n=1 Tax=Catharus ustulatus TaxID=91951 RepID=A0A8C3V1I7_CATUS
MAASRLVLLLLVAALLPYVATTLKIGAFNIKAFGDAKMSNQTIANIIVSVSRGERSRPGRALLFGMHAGEHPYSFLVSVPLGRTSYKEQYLFIYRSDLVSVLGSYYYDDGCEPCGNDTFSREPFIVKFSSPTTQVQEFVLVPLHSEPSHAAQEIDALYDVYTDVINKWGTNDIIFLGDFNADCSYVTSSQWPSIRLRSLRACEWLIPDSADTTVADTTNCAYDRWVIVACGTALRQDIEPGSATVNNFEKKFHLQIKDVSEGHKSTSTGICPSTAPGSIGGLPAPKGPLAPQPLSPLPEARTVPRAGGPPAPWDLDLWGSGCCFPLS